MKHLLTYQEKMILEDILSPLNEQPIFESWWDKFKKDPEKFNPNKHKLTKDTDAPSGKGDKFDNLLYDIMNRDKEDPIKKDLDKLLKEIESEKSEGGTDWSDKEREKIYTFLKTIKEIKPKGSKEVKNKVDDSKFDKIINKVKHYVKKGLITTGLLASLLAAPGLSHAQQSQLKQVSGIEQSINTGDTYSGKDLLKQLKQIKKGGGEDLSMVGSRKVTKWAEMGKDVKILKMNGSSTNATKAHAQEKAGTYNGVSFVTQNGNSVTVHYFYLAN